MPCTLGKLAASRIICSAVQQPHVVPVDAHGSFFGTSSAFAAKEVEIAPRVAPVLAQIAIDRCNFA
jgi:hypothetical protein